MDYISYWWSLVSRAISDAWSAIYGVSLWHIPLAIVGIVVFWSIYHKLSGKAEAHKQIRVIAITFITGIILFIGLSIFNLIFITPAKLYGEMKAERDSLKERVAADNSVEELQQVIDNMTIIKDAEDQRNKYVCVSHITPSWWDRGSHAVLIEFGVVKLPSDGFAVEIQMDGEFVKNDMYLDAPRMARPKAELLVVIAGPAKRFLVGKNTFQVSCRNEDITPKKSFYVYLESNGFIEPDLMLFYTAPSVAIGPSDAALRAGLSYRSCPQ